jgi:hypothetical protein
MAKMQTFDSPFEFANGVSALTIGKALPVFSIYFYGWLVTCPPVGN